MADKSMTIYTYFSAIRNEVKAALDNLILGRTPIGEVRTRIIRGGGKAKFVNVYYMTRMASLLTGFRWSSECLEEKYIPNESTPREVGAKMKVTLHDGEGNSYHMEAWGQSDVKKYVKDMVSERGGLIAKAGEPMSIIDDMKSAYSDGIKKCLSYFGIANDVYGGKDLDYFGSETPRPGAETIQGEVVDVTDQYINPASTSVDVRKFFTEFLAEKHITIGRACEILQVESINEIEDWLAAGKKIRDYLNK
jgi:hypothetical protein